MKLALWVAAALLVLAAVPVVPASAAFPTDWKKKPYFDVTSSELRLQTTHPGAAADCDWKGPREGTYYTTASSPDYTGWGCLTDFLWSETCKGGPQTVTFEKKVHLPGPALNLHASLVSLGDRPLRMSILINGVGAFRTNRSVHKLDLRGDKNFFRVGTNTITIQAEKPKTGSVDCNQSGAEYAVSAQILAKFGADIAVSPIPASPGVFVFDLTVTNRGPSRSSSTGVSFGAYTSKLVTHKVGNQLAAVVIIGPGIDVSECMYSYSSFYYEKKRTSYTGYSTSCSIGPLDPGESVSFKVGYRYKDPGGDFYEEWPAAWGASGDLFEPKFGNNSNLRMQAACRPAGPNCKPPKQ